MNLDGLPDASVVQLLMDRLPDKGYHLFRDLDSKTGMPEGTWAKHGAKAADQADRLQTLDEAGMRLKVRRIIRPS
jgi:hypothetical protein